MRRAGLWETLQLNRGGSALWLFVQPHGLLCDTTATRLCKVTLVSFYDINWSTSFRGNMTGLPEDLWYEILETLDGHLASARLGTCCKPMRDIVGRRCWQLRPALLPSMALSWRHIRALPRGLRRLAVPNHKAGFSVRGFDYLPPGLTELDFCMSDGVQDSAMRRLPRSLTQLRLGTTNTTCRGFTDAASSFLPQGLTHLDISCGGGYGSVGVADVFVAALPRCLLYLRLARAPMIGDTCIPLLPYKLQHLHLFGSVLLTDRGVAALPASLLSLGLYDSERLTIACYPSLPRGLRRLAVSHNHYWQSGVRSSTVRCFPGIKGLPLGLRILTTDAPHYAGPHQDSGLEPTWAIVDL